ncbi:MAG TPA: long-chain fatty acid--CoA ligase [Candidatus Polarisedimenticolia bacterium]|nr:long-chain fatty acid--CoA ligase [Candidatus Polarisedimenticolia bacterium]
MTIPELFERSIGSMPREAALSWWTPQLQRNVSTAALADKVRRFAAGLLALGLRKGDRVLLISENRPEWAATDYATAFAGGILVPVYVSLTPDQLHYILENSGARYAVASTQALLDKLLAAAHDVPNLSQVIVIDQDAAAEDVMHFDSVCAMGDDLLKGSPNAWKEPAARLKIDDVATIIYTSGTTGPPKGVMLSHGNLTSNVKVLCETLEFCPDDVTLSFLPLCHVTQRLADYCYFHRGARIVYVALDHVSAALKAVRPTTFPGVPRVFEKARDAILARAADRPAPLRALFRWGLEVGREMAGARLEGRDPGAWLKLRHALADRLVLSKVRQGLGGRLRFAVCGGAPLSPEVARFFLSFGLTILEGYGLTETTVLSINRHGRMAPGTVGPPLDGMELRMEEDGEILVRGPGVARGYYLDVKRTERDFQDGWFRTGDLGRLDDRGNLVITGRKKELLVTSGGKKVPPALIEHSLLAHDLISQAILVGDGRKFISALLVPDRAKVKARCKEMNLDADGSSFEALLRRREVEALFEPIISAVNRGLSRFEQIKKFVLLPDEFTIEGGELTPTMKVRRQVVEQKYRHLIEPLYLEPKEA